MRCSIAPPCPRVRRRRHRLEHLGLHHGLVRREVLIERQHHAVVELVPLSFVALGDGDEVGAQHHRRHALDVEEPRPPAATSRSPARAVVKFIAPRGNSAVSTTYLRVLGFGVHSS